MPNMDWIKRKRRIIGRIVNRKHLPDFTYRWDTRSPSDIRASGFQPWDPSGTIGLIEHVNNAYAADHALAGQLTKHDSQWISTGAYGMLKKIDPTFAQQILNTNLYKIDTQLALPTGNFHDANDTFDKANVNRPYSTQREWIKEGGVPQGAIVAYMTGRQFFNQYDMTNGAPDEDALTGWQPF